MPENLRKVNAIPYFSLTVPDYYNKMSAEELSYLDYLHKIAMTSDIEDSIESNTNKQIAANAFFTEKINSSIIDAQIASAKALYNNTQLITRQIGCMNASMSIELARLNSTAKESQKAICDKLDAITDILNNPNLVKSRELYNMASHNYDNGFYEEVLQDLQEAVKYNKTDYISWFLVGKTYLFGLNESNDSNVVDLYASVEALKKAVKYIKPIAKIRDEARVLAAEILFYLGLAQQSRANDALHRSKEISEYHNCLAEAQASFSQSWDYSPEMLETRYNLARCKALLGDTQGAIQDLETIIPKDPEYCIKVPLESDFDSIKGLFGELLIRLKTNVYPAVKACFDSIEKNIKKIQDSHLPEFIQLLKMYSSDTINENMPPFDILEKRILYQRIITLYKEFLDSTVFRIGINQIGLLIGHGEKNIKSLCEQYCVKIYIKDDGVITILGKNKENKEKARNAIMDIVATVLEVGNVYNGIITRIMDFGAFVKISSSKEGLVHISKLSRKRVVNVEDVVKVGQEIFVKLIEIDSMGRLSLSYVDAID
jgi:tetratricopeptide (TPR) repeat protein